MQGTVRLIFLLLALSCASFARCEGSISQFVPAVVGDDGGLVNVTMSLVPGDGIVYSTVYPRIGLTTQESIDDAVFYAHGIAGKSQDCDVLVSFSSNFGTGYVDGPSAGAALTVMAYALIEGGTLRDDAIMTGTIEPSGEIGPVGGLFEKARGAAEMGADYFITPVESFYEMLLLRNIEGETGMRVIQAQRVEDVIGFMIYNESIDQDGLAVQERPVPDVVPYDSSGIESFRPIAKGMVELERNATLGIIASDSESRAMRDFFANEALRQESLLSKGYLFSAANEAFLNYIDISTIIATLGEEPDLDGRRSEAEKCLMQTARPEMGDGNFEWVIGSDLRRAWAQSRINGTETDGQMLVDEKIYAYNELMYAQAWCHVSQELLLAAPGQGSAIDEGAWKALAESGISQAEAIGPLNADTSEKLDSAISSYDSGRYGAAIFDAVYVIENEEAYAGEPPEENISLLVKENRSSLWGRIYQSHAAFLMEQNMTSAAYRTALYAKGLDEAVSGMRAAMAYKKASSGEAAPEAETGYLVYAAAGISFLLLFLLLLAIRRIYGNKRKGPLKANRAQQKKG